MAGPTAHAAAPILRLDSVSKRFIQGERVTRVLDQVSLAVHRGELLVILGPSGSGKTTLLNLMGGLDNVSSGRVWFNQVDLASASPRQLTEFRRRHVGFVFQFYNLVPNLTAFENVELAACLVDDPLDVNELLGRFGLTDRQHHFPGQLSGGEQQRVAVARAVVKRPDLLLCDEPTGALDYETAKEVLALLQRLPEEFGTAVVLVTHNQAIARLAHRVIRLRSGQIVAESRNEQPVRASELVW